MVFSLQKWGEKIGLRVMRWVWNLGWAYCWQDVTTPWRCEKDKAELAFYIEEFYFMGVQVLEMSYYRANPTKVTVQPSGFGR